MDKKNFYLDMYKNFVLTLLLILIIVFYLDISSKLDSISSTEESIKSVIEQKMLGIIDSRGEINSESESLKSFVDDFSEKVYNASLASANRDGLTADLLNLAAMAQQYYRKPSNLGGGGNSFLEWSIPESLENTGNGKYLAKISSDRIILIGIGNEIGEDEVENVKITMIISSDRILDRSVEN
ncbi:MAG: hypothetical protein A2068_06215 [Ignavibacteria bacterium GWB2_35_6b]|nr:MAG: hypothetical protein A2068_06215 [Ignavibacteria bacterium GWB2_35_6b]